MAPGAGVLASDEAIGSLVVGGVVEATLMGSCSPAKLQGLVVHQPAGRHLRCAAARSAYKGREGGLEQVFQVGEPLEDRSESPQTKNVGSSGPLGHIDPLPGKADAE